MASAAFSDGHNMPPPNLLLGRSAGKLDPETVSTDGCQSTMERDTNMPQHRRLRVVLMGVLLLCIVAAIYLQHNIGLADTGDFTRTMRLFTSGPVGMASNLPFPSSEDYGARFFNYWIPAWKLELSLATPRTSALLLWGPGVALNYLLSSRSRALSHQSVASSQSATDPMFLAAVPMDRDRPPSLEGRGLHALGIPVAFMLTTTDYVAYLNTFYTESASFVYLFLVLTSLLFLLRKRESRTRLALSVAAIFLFATARIGNTYWLLLSIPVAFLVRASGVAAGGQRVPWGRNLLLACTAAVALLALPLAYTSAFRTEGSFPGL